MSNEFIEIDPVLSKMGLTQDRPLREHCSFALPHKPSISSSVLQCVPQRTNS